jgi:hypothetical protein
VGQGFAVGTYLNFAFFAGGEDFGLVRYYFSVLGDFSGTRFFLEAVADGGGQGGWKRVADLLGLGFSDGVLRAHRQFEVRTGGGSFTDY